MKNLVDAFTDFDVTKEKHQGIINNFISDKSLICPSYHKDDIVFVKKDKKTTSMNHLFVLIDENMHGRLLTTTKKGTYVKKNSTNNLIFDSYISDTVYKIEPDKILFKIGRIK